jgi:hypothetical protein
VEGAHVVLLEVVVRGIDDQRNAARHLVLEFRREVGVRLLGQHDGRAGEGLFLGIIENLDVLALQRQPMERVVLNLVLAEGVVLRRRRRRSRENRDRSEREKQSSLLHAERVLG